MPQGLSTAVANAILDAYCRSVAWSEPAGFFVKLHTGDPGAAGAGNAFGDTTRQSVTFSAASGGAITNSSPVTWTNLSAAGTITHVSFWDASTAGTFIGSDALAASKTVAIGDNAEFAAGALDLAITPIAS